MKPKKEILKTWIKYAYIDLDVSKRLLNSPKPNQWTYVLVIWHCHQAIEKMFKMTAIKNNKELLKIHDLIRLYKQAGIKDFPEKYINFLYDLNEYYISPRYPDLSYKKPYPKSDRKKAENYLKLTNNIYQWLEKYAFPKK